MYQVIFTQLLIVRENIKMDLRINDLSGYEWNSAGAHRYPVVDSVVYVMKFWVQDERKKHTEWLNDY
jgi:hypothetical protein